MQTQRGFIILYTLLISSIILAMAIGIAGIAYKEVGFSIQSSQSHVAFFAADAGIECALKYDLQSPSLFTGTTQLGISCASFPNVSVNYTAGPNNSDVYTLEESAGQGVPVDNGCFKVIVTKNATDVVNGQTLTSGTIVESHGYNMSCSDVATIQANPQQNSTSRLVERVLEYRYHFVAQTQTGGGTTTSGSGTTASGTGTTSASGTTTASGTTGVILQGTTGNVVQQGTSGGSGQ